MGVASAGGAVVLDYSDARAAAGQTWSPFVLVAGLLLVGLVAEHDGLFSSTGRALARAAPDGRWLYALAVAQIAIVTAVLNLDTSVAFLTPVLVYAARSRGGDERALLYGCLLLSNAASLLLPGSNLTNVIVLDHFDLSGLEFARRMALPWVAAVVVTALVVAVAERDALRRPLTRVGSRVRPVRPAGIAAVVAATIVMLASRAAALPVLLIGLLAIGRRVVTGDVTPRRAVSVLSLPILLGLFGIAVAVGTVGRAWSGPADLTGHMNGWTTAGFAALATVALNNLPAASLLASRVPPHPFALLVGLNIGPNLFASGSLAWVLWWRVSVTIDARPSLRRATMLGVVAVPLALVAAMALLTLTGRS